MNSTGDELSITLRDIHTPAGVSLWPLAPGWWFVIALAVVVVAVLVWLWWRHARPPLLSALAQREFETIIAPGFGDSLDRFVALDLLLRRLACACPGGATWRADTTGAWFDWLSHQSGLADSAPALAAQLARVPFQPAQNVDVGPLIARTRAIIQGLPAVRSDRELRDAG